MTDQSNVNVNKNSNVTLHEVTKENLWDIFCLEVAPEQSRYVATNEMSIAQAYFDREIAWFCAIYADSNQLSLWF